MFSPAPKFESRLVVDFCWKESGGDGIWWWRGALKIAYCLAVCLLQSHGVSVGPVQGGAYRILGQFGLCFTRNVPDVSL